MNFSFSNLAFESQQTWELIGWTMCYFLLLGTVVALIGAVIRFGCRPLSPQIRYTVSLAVFVSLALLPIGIAFWLLPTEAAEPAPVAMLADSAPVIRQSAEPLVIDLKEQPVTDVIPDQILSKEPVPQPVLETPAVEGDIAKQEYPTIAGVITYLPWVWIVGAPLTFLLLTTGLIGSQRLRQQSKLITEGPLHEACHRLRESLRMTRQVGLAVCERVASPLLVGIVRPMILLPPAALSGWSPEELEMVLLHELAHVRRWDNLVNFLQRVVESLLFFHPCVWWVSRWVRVDREECCDAVVVGHTAKPQAYAELLVALATPTSPLIGLAMAQHPLAGRIRRILKIEEEKMLVSRSALGWLGLVGAALVIAALWQPSAEIVAEETTVVEAVKEKTAEVAESAEGRSNNNNTRVDNSYDVERIFNAPTPTAFASPDEATIWRETQTALIKSKLVLQRAIQTIAEDDTLIEVPELEWLQSNLKIRFTPGAVILGLEGKSPRGFGLGPLDYYLKRIGESYRQELLAQRRITAAGKVANTPFLSLEEQRAADLAYKLLNVELEQLGAEDLKRVQAKKFAGGLLVSGVKLGGRNSAVPLRRGDLLVGLHVWPTTSLTEIREILQRDDLQELSPLKFYVIRKTEQQDANHAGEFGGGYGGGDFGGAVEMVDTLVTGRVEVNAFMRPTVVAPPLNAGAVVPGPIYAPQPLPPGVTVEGPIRTVRPAEAKPTLFYDNKTFKQWRTLWKNELKTEKRTEAIQAMAAFARAGYGKEAAEAILDVAGEYDFSSWGGDDPAGKLKNEVVGIFTGHGKQRLAPEFWLSGLLERLDKDPDRWQGLAVAVLWSGYSKQPEIQSQLLAAAKNEKYSPATRGAALQALVYSDFELKNSEVVKLIHNTFASDEPELVKAACKSLYFRKLDEFPEQLELFFHPEESVRHEARMRLGNNPSWLPISKHLQAVLNDPQRAEDHENAIDAFGWGTVFSSPGSFKQKQVMIDRLYEILISGDKDLLPSAIRALKNLTSQADTLVIQKIDQEITPQRRGELAAAVEILKSSQGQGGGFGVGGGGLGGGGGFF